jgi:hypothetical protein
LHGIQARQAVDAAQRVEAFGRAVHVAVGGERRRADEEQVLLFDPGDEFGVNVRFYVGLSR